MDEIENNDYNLNIPRYVDTFEEEEHVDLQKVINNINSLDKEISDIESILKASCEQLGVSFPGGK